MQNNTGKIEWEKYVERETHFFVNFLVEAGFVLDTDQVHTKGERYAFRAQKLILTGKEKNTGKKVIIKVTREKEGKEEILHERECRQALKKIDFAYHEFLDPTELFFESNKIYTILVTEFIQEEKQFLQRTLQEQFDIALKSFTVQEGIHAVTASHQKFIDKHFENFTFIEYKKYLENYKNIILNIFHEDQNLKNILEQAEIEFNKNDYRVNQYCGFLTHTDFVPHNFRVRDGKIYLLDHSAIRIGSKHEGWGRFLNFMTLYNRDLENLFIKYFADNRSLEEIESLRLMRIFRLFDLIHHHAKIYRQAEGELKSLSYKRVFFWLELLKSILENKQLEQNIIEEYKNSRDTLRTVEEKERQKVLY